MGYIAVWTFCPAGSWTRIYQSISPFAFVYVWAQTPPASVSYRYYSASPPFYWTGEMVVQEKSTLWVGTPTPYIEVWINPQSSGNFRVT